MLFLQILGGLFLVVLLVAAWYGWKIFRFFRRVKSGDFGTNADKAYSLLPQMHIELEASDSSEWVSSEYLFSTENDLRKLGFEHKGYKVCYMDSASIQLSLWLYKNTLTCIVYEAVPVMSGAEPIKFVDCSVKLGKEASFTVSNSESAGLMPRPNKHKFIYKQTLEVKELLKILKAYINKGLKPSRIIDLEQFFIHVGEECAEWVWREEQLRSDQIKQVFSQAGIELNEEEYAELISQSDSSRSDLRSRQVKKVVAQNPKISAAQWEKIRDDIVVLHSEMGLGSFVSAVEEMCVGMSDAQYEMLAELEESQLDLKVFDEFEKLKQPLEQVLQVKKIAQISQPISAQVYLRQ